MTMEIDEYNVPMAIGSPHLRSKIAKIYLGWTRLGQGRCADDPGYIPVPETWRDSLAAFVGCRPLGSEIDDVRLEHNGEALG